MTTNKEHHYQAHINADTFASKSFNALSGFLLTACFPKLTLIMWPHLRLHSCGAHKIVASFLFFGLQKLC